VCGTLSSPSRTRAHTQELFEESKWDDLVNQFRRNNFVLHSLTAQSLLSITLQCGLAALKTPTCFETHSTNNAAVSTFKNKNCPVCQEDMNILAQPLPYAQHVNSCLVCRISGAIMNEDNPPMVLPNGNVYGYNALMDLLHNTGVCA
jgi:macrophage erythroblast attacher